MTACDLALESVLQLQPYQPGKPIDELERELGISGIIKLASNENPMGPSQSVLKAIDEASKELTRYPDGNGFALKSALAEKYQLEREQITLGNGSNDVLELAARAFVSAADDVIFSQYAFAVYPLITQAIGARSVIAPARDFGHDLDAMSSLVNEKTKLVFIASPNNPTGTALDAEALEDFISSLPPHVIVVLDEAYTEYQVQNVNTVKWLEKYPNLIITRTFSKAYGLAGLRVGYSLSNSKIADMLNRIRQPFNVNSLALAAAIEALADENYIKLARELNDKGMMQLISGFEQMDLDYIPSKGNFICVDVACNGGQCFQSLLKQGVITRPVANYGLPQHLRVSIGSEQENEGFLTALRTVLGKCHD